MKRTKNTRRIMPAKTESGIQAKTNPGKFHTNFISIPTLNTARFQIREMAAPIVPLATEEQHGWPKISSIKELQKPLKLTKNTAKVTIAKIQVTTIP